MQRAIHTTDDGVELAVWSDGPDEAPITVILTHGYAQAHGCWHAQVDALAAAGFRVVVWDLRGHGESARPPIESCTIDRVADDLAEIITRRTTGPVLLVGHSMGGMALMALAERRPNLVRDRVRGVAFVATSTRGDGLGSLGLGLRGAHVMQALGAWTFGRLARHDWSWQLVSGLGPVLEISLLVSCCGWGTSRDDVRLTGQMAGEAGFWSMAAFLPSLQSHQREQDLEGYAGLPCLVINGSADLVVPPADCRAIAEALPGSRAVVVPRAGHNVMLAAPTVVSRELVGLARRASAGE